MKKIKSITQLELEQARLKLREAELEKNIRKDWKELRKSVQPGHLGKELFKKAGEKFKTFFGTSGNSN